MLGDQESFTMEETMTLHGMVKKLCTSIDTSSIKKIKAKRVGTPINCLLSTTDGRFRKTSSYEIYSSSSGCHSSSSTQPVLSAKPVMERHASVKPKEKHSNRSVQDCNLDSNKPSEPVKQQSCCPFKDTNDLQNGTSVIHTREGCAPSSLGIHASTPWDKNLSSSSLEIKGIRKIMKIRMLKPGYAQRKANDCTQKTRKLFTVPILSAPRNSLSDSCLSQNLLKTGDGQVCNKEVYNLANRRGLIENPDSIKQLSTIMGDSEFDIQRFKMEIDNAMDSDGCSSACGSSSVNSYSGLSIKSESDSDRSVSRGASTVSNTSDLSTNSTLFSGVGMRVNKTSGSQSFHVKLEEGPAVGINGNGGIKRYLMPENVSETVGSSEAKKQRICDQSKMSTTASLNVLSNLKSRILRRCSVEGKEYMDWVKQEAERQEELKMYTMTEDERHKAHERKLRNRDSARKFRMKTKARNEYAMKTFKEESEKNRHLKERLLHVHKQMIIYQNLLRSHIQECKQGLRKCYAQCPCPQTITSSFSRKQKSWIRSNSSSSSSSSTSSSLSCCSLNVPSDRSRCTPLVICTTAGDNLKNKFFEFEQNDTNESETELDKEVEKVNKRMFTAYGDYQIGSVKMREVKEELESSAYDHTDYPEEAERREFECNSIISEGKHLQTIDAAVIIDSLCDIKAIKSRGMFDGSLKEEGIRYIM